MQDLMPITILKNYHNLLDIREEEMQEKIQTQAHDLRGVLIGILTV